MRRLALSEQARADLVELVAFSRRTWGPERTELYVRAMLDRIQKLRERPKASAPRSEMHPRLRSARAGRHLIFFVADEEQVFLVRVVHERTDANRSVLRTMREMERDRTL